MSELKCLVYDDDKFTRELILGFVKKTKGLTSINKTDAKEADIVLVDAAMFDGDYMVGLKEDIKIVIMSSNQQYIHSFFQNKIADYFVKSELSLERFDKAIDKIRAKREEQSS